MNFGHVMTRWAPVVIGLLLLVFGIACFNYTKPGTLQHHRAWAAEHGRPAPTDTIVWGGASSAIFGAFAVGFGVGFGLAGSRRGRAG